MDTVGGLHLYHWGKHSQSCTAQSYVIPPAGPGLTVLGAGEAAVPALQRPPVADDAELALARAPREECVAARPEVRELRPGGGEEEDRDEDVLHADEADLQHQPEVEAAAGGVQAGVDSLQRVQQQVQHQDQRVAPEQLVKCHKILPKNIIKIFLCCLIINSSADYPVSVFPVVPVCGPLEPGDPEHVADGPDQHQQRHDPRLPLDDGEGVHHRHILVTGTIMQSYC